MKPSLRKIRRERKRTHLPYPTLADVSIKSITPKRQLELTKAIMKSSVFAPLFEMTPDEVDELLGRKRES